MIEFVYDSETKQEEFNRIIMEGSLSQVLFEASVFVDAISNSITERYGEEIEVFSGLNKNDIKDSIVTTVISYSLSIAISSLYAGILANNEPDVDRISLSDTVHDLISSHYMHEKLEELILDVFNHIDVNLSNSALQGYDEEKRYVS